jgi:serine/threonine-protein kinase
MWHQSGSFKNLSWKRAKKWVIKLNENGYAGFKDWRLPTLEETVSLLGPEKNGNQFIDPAFDRTQSSIWTGDSNISNASLSLDRAWSVNFNYGSFSRNDIMIERRKVRPVRIYSGG